MKIFCVEMLNCFVLVSCEVCGFSFYPVRWMYPRQAAGESKGTTRPSSAVCWPWHCVPISVWIPLYHMWGRTPAQHAEDLIDTSRPECSCYTPGIYSINCVCCMCNVLETNCCLTLSLPNSCGSQRVDQTETCLLLFLVIKLSFSRACMKIENWAECPMTLYRQTENILSRMS